MSIAHRSDMQTRHRIVECFRLISFVSKLQNLGPPRRADSQAVPLHVAASGRSKHSRFHFVRRTPVTHLHWTPASPELTDDSPRARRYAMCWCCFNLYNMAGRCRSVLASCFFQHCIKLIAVTPTAALSSGLSTQGQGRRALEQSRFCKSAINVSS
ncbi:unnamed protein product [Amoebophrya sp. A120]|nr:unnamed protein product [Amoebophrya sp. A120]|eukprot:GSA120T00006631001.1